MRGVKVFGNSDAAPDDPDDEDHDAQGKPISGCETGPGKSQVLADLVRGEAAGHSLISLKR